MTNRTTYEQILDLEIGSWSIPDSILETLDGDDRWLLAPEDLISEHLTLLGDVDFNKEPYQFDLLRVWQRNSDGTLLWAYDSGCSCPSPFEGTKVSDLKESTRSGFMSAVEPVLLAHSREEERKSCFHAWSDDEEGLECCSCMHYRPVGELRSVAREVLGRAK